MKTTIKEIIKNGYDTDKVLIKNEKNETIHEWLPINRLSRNELNYIVMEYDFEKEPQDLIGYYIITIQEA